MRIPRIFIDQPLHAGHDVELRDQAYNHIARVLRLKAGASIMLFNGDGRQYPARLTALDRKQGRAAIEQPLARDVESPLSITLGQCISKGERMDYAIQKSVELGVHTIVPLFSERCNVQLNNERLDKKHHHWRAVAISACEQCGRNRLPAIAPAQPLTGWIATVDVATKLVLDPTGQPLADQRPPPDGSVAVLIGPEGGLGDEEIRAAQHHGFNALRLGPRVLRTETAAVATLSAVQTLWGDFCL